jgi:minor extracellular serine protease Vpr
VKSFRIITSLCLSFVFFVSLSSNQSHAFVQTKSRIDSAFLQNVSQSSNKEIVILRLKGDDAVTYTTKTSATYSNTSAKDLNLNFQIDEAYATVLKEYQNSFIQQLQKNIPFDLVHQYQLVTNAIAINISGYHIPMLLKYNQIEGIYSTRDLAEPHRNIAKNSIQASTAWKMINPESKLPYDGKGIAIGILDSGIDYYNTEFNRTENIRPEDFKEYQFQATDKILGGYDFADSDKDPFDAYNPPHGTHVAGISSGNHPTNPSFKGMAPESNLFVYKVFSSDPSKQGANPSNIIAAAEQSIKDKCSIINLSLGNSYPTPSIDDGNPYYEAIKNTVKAGIVVVASAGNNGSRHKEASNTLSAPGTFEPALQVAASADRTVQNIQIVGPQGELISIQATHGLHTPLFEEKHSGLEVVDCSFGRKEDFSKVNVKGKIALISRGPMDAGIPFFEKNTNARDAGAIGTIVYNYAQNQGEQMNPTLMPQNEYIEDPTTLKYIPFLFINYVNADAIKRLVIEGKGRINFLRFSSLTVSDFTSVGPCMSADDNIFKPEISAPGKQIRSTVVVLNKETGNFEPSYQDWDGTSMSAPVVSGGVALIRQARPTLNAEEIKALVMNTSDLMYNHVTGEILSYFYQGAGHLNVAAAIDSPLMVRPPAVMRKTNQVDEAITLTVKNIYKEKISFSIRSEVFNLNNQTNPIRASFNPSNLTLNPNESSSFRVQFSIDEDSFIDRKYEGAIWIEIDQLKKMNLKTETIRVPFILYKDKLEKIDEPITHLSTSKSTICSDKMDQALVSFRINTGSMVSIKGDQTLLNFQNYAYQFSVYAVDRAGEIWGEIYQGENMPIGNYSFLWDGKDIWGKEFLPDGEFYLQAAISGVEVTVRGGSVDRVSKPYLSSQVPVLIQGSSIPQPPVVAFGAPTTVNIDQEFKLDVVFADLKDISELVLTFKVNSRLEIMELIPGSFVDMEKLDPNKDIKESRGEITIKATRDPQMQGDRASVVSVRVRAKRRGNADTLVSDFKLKDAKGNQRKTLVFMQSIEIVDKPFILGDFNEDGLVNDLDLGLLLDAYLTTFKNPQWDTRFDLNNDLIVDIADLVIFSKQYKEGV